jgi:hypothetical protein
MVDEVEYDIESWSPTTVVFVAETPCARETYTINRKTEAVNSPYVVARVIAADSKGMTHLINVMAFSGTAREHRPLPPRRPAQHLHVPSAGCLSTGRETGGECRHRPGTFRFRSRPRISVSPWASPALWRVGHHFHHRLRTHAKRLRASLPSAIVPESRLGATPQEHWLPDRDCDQASQQTSRLQSYRPGCLSRGRTFEPP